MYLKHFRVILRDSYNTHIVKLILKAHKNDKNYYQKHKERLKKKHAKSIKIFLKKKKTKGKKKKPEKDFKIQLQKIKKKSFRIIVNVIQIFLRNKSRS